MEQKKSLKINLSTFFLILAIIAIFIMGYFLYTSNSKTTDMISNEKELNAKIARLEEETTNKQSQTEPEQNNTNNDLNSNGVNNKNTTSSSDTLESSITFNSLRGIYVGNAEVEAGGDKEVTLYLYENGSYSYNNQPGFESGHVGYYTFNDNNLILHEILQCGNDIGRYVTSDTTTLKINEDKSIIDSKLNATLKKSSKTIEKEYDVISTELKNAINNKSLN